VQGVDECLTYEWQQFSTLNFDPLDHMTQVVAKRLAKETRVGRLGWQAEAVPALVFNTTDRLLGPDEWVDVDAGIREMQRRKDADELEVLRGAIRANLAAYDAVQQVIAPGINELDVLAAGYRGAMSAAGEKVFHDGDYRSGVAGGPARNRAIESGEIYIVDAWTVYRGYWSDLCRAFSVGGRPSDLQQSIYDHIAAVQRWAGRQLKPGLRGTELWRAMDERVREHAALAEVGLIHHAGHGTGLRAHTEPDLNRDREGILEVGNVVCVEPGAYVPEARGGVRLENTYLITETGAELLSDYPLQLTCT
jgi:Xaa-Pro aminopeptidase